MRVQQADRSFRPTHRPIGMSADLVEVGDGRRLVQMKAVVMINDDGTRNGRSTFTVWTRKGNAFELAEFLIPTSGE